LPGKASEQGWPAGSDSAFHRDAAGKKYTVSSKKMNRITRFRDRTEAGQRLAKKLGRYANRKDVLILALPRGGVPVGFEVANALNAPLDILVVRKLGVPGQEELAMGAIANGGVRVLNQEVISRAGITDQVIEAVTARELKELRRRELAYRGDTAAPQISGKTIILVDNGIATGSTMRAAIAALRQQGSSNLVIAVPTASLSSWHELRPIADELVAVMMPEPFFAVGVWYAIFSQTSDEQVRQLFDLSRHRQYKMAA
jgi:predicted phosphoribosyltransferase